MSRGEGPERRAASSPTCRWGGSVGRTWAAGALPSPAQQLQALPMSSLLTLHRGAFRVTLVGPELPSLYLRSIKEPFLTD